MNYKQVDPSMDLVNVEKQILKYWDKNNIFKKVNNARKNSKPWVLYDGPMTANNLPHYGHVITWTVKDVMPRYWTMQNRFVSRNVGWDCQGIPVEYEVEKRLGFEHKDQIEQYGVEKFNKLCKESVLEYRQAMVDYEKRVGRWLDKTDTYSTMNKDYIESIWWSLKELYKKGLLYEGRKVVPYSTRAGTPLSNAEVALGGYKEIKDPAVTVKFKLNKLNAYALAWTTTPWTLPGNLLLSVGKNIKYVLVKHKGEKYVLAKNCVKSVFGKDKVEVLKQLKASQLQGLTYTPLFSYFKDKSKEGAFKVVYADHVTTEEGTGIVHLAPYGEEDFNILSNLKIETFDYLDETGSFTDQIPNLKGYFYKKANKYIVEDLKQNNQLFKLKDYPHQMPICWRTDTPLIYKPIKSWFLAVTKIKDGLLSENSKISWIPPHVKNGRFGVWLKNARDWALSRNRYWGTPIPAFVNDKTGEVIMVGSYKELQELSGKKLGKDFDPHRPFVDNITFKGKNGGTFKRVSDVLDVWYDSGSMPFAQYHYPFKNKNKFNSRFPANFISESVDQTRGWFYSLIVINTALFGKSPYKSVSMSGMLLGDDGQKLSKSKKNYPPIEEVLNNFGADILRYFLLTSPVVRGESAKFSNQYLNEVKKEFFITLWNSYRYFVTYASANKFVPSKDLFKPTDLLDKWVLLKLNQTINEVNKYLKKSEVMYATRQLSPFVQDLSTWYIRRSRDKISNGEKDALNTLYVCLNTLSKLMAPFMPFVSEEIYLNINDKESVHLELFPKATKFLSSDKLLLKNMEVTRQVASAGNAVRKLKNIPVRQPLSLIQVKHKKLPNEFVEILKEELNVKSVKFVKSLSKTKDFVQGEGVAFNTKITPKLQLEGEFRNLVRSVQSMRKQKGLQVDQYIKLTIENTTLNNKILKEFGDELKQKVGAKTVVTGKNLNVTAV